jgi:hypothetical protein
VSVGGERRRGERISLADKYCSLADQILVPPTKRVRDRAKALVRLNREQRDLMKRLLADQRRRREEARKIAERAKKNGKV